MADAPKSASRNSDARLGQECEMLIALKTHFTGEPPYVGNEGVLLALRESLDELNRLRSERRSSKQLTQHGLIEATAAMLHDHGWKKLARSIRATKKEMPDCPIVNMPGCPQVPPSNERNST